MSLHSLTLQNATGIIRAINGKFSGGKTHEIAVAHGEILDILRPDKNGKIQMIHSAEVLCDIRSLAKFRLTGAQRDYIVVASDSGRIVCLEYNEEKNVFDQVWDVMLPKDKVHHETFGFHRIVPDQCLAVDPKGRAVMIGACEKHKLVYVFNRDTADSLTISSPLEVHKSRTICYSVCGVDCGFNNPIFAAIEIDYSEADLDHTGQVTSDAQKLLTFYELDLRLNHVSRKWSEPVDNGANMLVTVPGGAYGPSGVLVCAENCVIFKNQGHPDVRAMIPRRADLPVERGVLVVSAATHKQKTMFFFLIQTNYDDVFKVTLDHDGDHVSELKIKYFDTIPASASICVLKPEFLFSASESGSYGLYQFLAIRDKSDVESSSSNEEGFQPVLFQPRQLMNLVRIDHVESLMPIMNDWDLATHYQLQEVMAARALARDHCLSFSFQINEAITDLLLEDLVRLDQQRQDRLLLEKEMNDVKTDLDLRLHDKRFAQQVHNAPEKRWKKQGNSLQKPYIVGDSSVRDEMFFLYCKGLVRKKRIGDFDRLIGGVGLVICDSAEHHLWEVNKVLEGEEDMSHPEVVELAAIIHGLKWALEFDLRMIKFYCHDSNVLDYVTGKMVSTNSTVATLVKEVGLLQKRFSSCQALPVCKDITFVCQLAEAAISSQIRQREQTCIICYEDFQCDKMFEVPGCFHLFCDVCMKKFLRRTLVCGKRAICPMENCESEIHREACVDILDPEQLSVIDQRKMESEINVRDRVYCPEPTCSALMANHKLLKHTNEFFLGAEQVGARKCMVCGTFFCINCNSKWHYHMTCDQFRKTQTYQTSNHAKFESVAERHGLKKCRVCNTMVERAYGCNHMTCRCKYEFCYTCGAEWIKKKQTCKCRLMD